MKTRRAVAGLTTIIGLATTGLVLIPAAKARTPQPPDLTRSHAPTCKTIDGMPIAGQSPTIAIRTYGQKEIARVDSKAVVWTSSCQRGTGDNIAPKAPLAIFKQR